MAHKSVYSAGDILKDDATLGFTCEDCERELTCLLLEGDRINEGLFCYHCGRYHELDFILMDQQGTFELDLDDLDVKEEE